jgi:hypothetical protein
LRSAGLAALERELSASSFALGRQDKKIEEIHDGFERPISWGVIAAVSQSQEAPCLR